MQTKEKAVSYRLIETELTRADLTGEESSVFSVLALYREDDIVTSEFVYDISRNKLQAEYVLSALKFSTPNKDELCDFISELL